MSLAPCPGKHRKLFRNTEKRERGNTSTQSIKQQSIAQSLEPHGYDEDEIDEALTTLVEAGGLQDWYSSNAYTYGYFMFTDYVIDAIEEALHSHEQKIRTQVGDYAEEEPYLDTLLDLTRGTDRYTYQKEIADETDEKALETAIQDGAVVIEYRPGRSSTGRRSSLPTRSYAVLAPAVRDVVSDAVFRLKID